MGGPRSLRALLANWNPRQGRARGAPRADHASSAFAAAWDQAVGPEIARRAKPTKFSGGVLTVLTASSAWSDELSLHAPRIIEALQRASPDERLRKLRFMVASGRTKLLLEGERYRARSGPKPVPATNQTPRTRDNAARDAEDVRAAVARLAASQQALNDERDRAGWRVCVSCERRFLPESPRIARCAPCAENGRRARLAEIERALMQAPWLSCVQMLQALPRTTTQAYERTRQRLLARWQFEITAAERRLRRGSPTAEDRVIAWSYLMLLTGLPQRDVGRAVVGDVLGREWVVVLFGDAAAQKQEARRALREKHNR